VARGRN